MYLSHSRNLTYDILTTIGSPFISAKYVQVDGMINELYRYAVKNRMPLLYLEALKRLGKIGSLRKKYNKLNDRYIKTIQAIFRVSQVLERASVDYAFFKTMRPYREVTVDIDTIVFGSDYKKAVRALSAAGYRLLEVGPLSTTLRDDDLSINVDIYDEISASYIVYLNKDKLSNFVIDQKLPNSIVVRSLSVSAHLLAIISHSVLKEQMYVLSEYYSTLYYLFNVSKAQLDEFLGLASNLKLVVPVTTHLGITSFLHRAIHKFIPDKLAYLLDESGFDVKEIKRLAASELSMPHKYHFLTITHALIEKLGEQKARRSFAVQGINMFRSRSGLSVVGKLLNHKTRENY
jgi:hypothetical protein